MTKSSWAQLVHGWVGLGLIHPKLGWIKLKTSHTKSCQSQVGLGQTQVWLGQARPKWGWCRLGMTSSWVKQKSNRVKSDIS